MSDQNETLTPDIRFHLVRKMERHKVIALVGTELRPHEARYLEFHNVSGVILFRRNIESLSQVTELVARINENLSEEGKPALIMADHEGDFVSELSKIIGVPPAPLAIAAARDVELAREVAYETGAVAKKLGVNTILAPVADLYLNADSPITGLRTFGRDPEIVAQFVTATIEGFREAGVLSCAKHFPGHGDTPEDSHETLPEVLLSQDFLYERDLVPFRAAVEAGADMVMMSHVAFPLGRDELIPASFDRKIAREMLRDDLGFSGVVITDALEMAGARWYASGRYGLMGGGFETSLLAGCDLMLHSQPVPEQVQVSGKSDPVLSINVMETIIKTLETVVDRSRIDEKLTEAADENEPLRNVLAILDASFARVSALRSRLAGMCDPPRVPGNTKVIAFNSYPSVPSVYGRVAEASVAAFGEWHGACVTPGQRVALMPVLWNSTESLKEQNMEAFLDVLCKRFPTWERTAPVVDFSTGIDGEIRPTFARRVTTTVVDAARYTGTDEVNFELDPDEDLIIVLSARGTPPEEFMPGLQSFAEQASPVAVIVTGWPVTNWLPEDTPTLLSLGASTQVALAVAQIMAGESDPVGNLDGILPGRPL